MTLDPSNLTIFALTFFVFAASPGPDNMTIISKTLSGGIADGLAYGFGVVFSIFCFVLLSTFGLSAISTTLNAKLFILKYIGATYLIYIGINMWNAPCEIQSQTTDSGFLKLFFVGFILNISNPKMPFFYLALLPSLIGGASFSLYDTLIILAVIAVVECVVIGGHIFAIYKMRNAFLKPSRMRMLNRGASVLMICAGTLVATR